VGFLFGWAPGNVRHIGGHVLLMDGRVLVLNQNYEPLHICNWQRAITLVYAGKATTVEADGRLLRSPTIEMRLPTVVRLYDYVSRPLPEIKLSRRAILARDDHRCQYCGARTRDLTIDHVIPRERGGAHTWENLVASCRKCNNKKGNHTPREANLKLLKRPRRPRFIPYLSFATFRAAIRNDTWRDYLEPFAPQLLDGSF
jgi:5-methylcytosine-specific restriction endonuclease McrA